MHCFLFCCSLCLVLCCGLLYCFVLLCSDFAFPPIWPVSFRNFFRWACVFVCLFVCLLRGHISWGACYGIGVLACLVACLLCLYACLFANFLICLVLWLLGRLFAFACLFLYLPQFVFIYFTYTLFFYLAMPLQGTTSACWPSHSPSQETTSASHRPAIAGPTDRSQSSARSISR